MSDSHRPFQHLRDEGEMVCVSCGDYSSAQYCLCCAKVLPQQTMTPEQAREIVPLRIKAINFIDVDFIDTKTGKPEGFRINSPMPITLTALAVLMTEKANDSESG